MSEAQEITLRTTCPSCSGEMDYSSRLMGATALCPHCGERVALPLLATPPLIASVAQPVVKKSNGFLWAGAGVGTGLGCVIAVGAFFVVVVLGLLILLLFAALL